MTLRKNQPRARQRWGVLIASVMLLAGVLGVGSAFAVHDAGNFELDGNATNSNAAGDDWDNVCHQVTAGAECASASDTNGATAVAWVSEPNTSASIFTGGGSKDPIDISSWAWKDAGGLPDKDNLTHGFAARYSQAPSATCPAGTAATCDILYFGSDRFDNSGDAQQGFWFFQNAVTLSNIKDGGGFKFNGVHRVGDILIISDFSNGGTVSTISVYKWDPTVTGNLNLLLSSDAANCGTAAAGDAACGIVNPGPGLTTSPWAFTDKSGNHNFLNGELYEGGINLSTLGLANECFRSVASETRSSTSTTATLKDFVLGQFASCSATMSTQRSSSSVNPGVSVTDTATVTGSNPNVTPSGNVTFFLCSGVAAGGDCASGGAQVGTTVALSGVGATATATSAAVNTAANPLGTGHYCFRAEWPGDANYIGALSHTNSTTECFDVVQSGTTTTTTPQVSGSNVSGPVAVNAQVTDHAVVVGASGFGNVTGTINFFICNPSQTTGAAGAERCVTGGTAAGSKTADPVAGADPPRSTADSNAVTANVVGVWCFRAEYVSNTANYTNSSDSSHGECFTVRDSSSVSTAQNWLPNDSATVSTTGGTAVSGTLTFQLYTGDSCASGNEVSGQFYTFTLTNATSLADRTKATANTTYLVSATSSVSWGVVFTPSAGSLVDAPAQASCEKTSLTITN